jgi:hypothetical protein
MWWHKRRNQISSFDETDESIHTGGAVSSVDYCQPSCAHQPAGFVLLVQACVLQSCDAYCLPTPFSCFPFTSPPVRHRVPSHFKRSLPVVWRLLCLRGINKCVIKIKMTKRAYTSPHSIEVSFQYHPPLRRINKYVNEIKILSRREANTQQHNIFNFNFNIILPSSKVTPSRQFSRPRKLISNINITQYEVWNTIRHLKYQRKALTPVDSKPRTTGMGSCMRILF